MKIFLLDPNDEHDRFMDENSHLLFGDSVPYALWYIEIVMYKGSTRTELWTMYRPERWTYHKQKRSCSTIDECLSFLMDENMRLMESSTDYLFIYVEGQRQCAGEYNKLYVMDEITVESLTEWRIATS